MKWMLVLILLVVAACQSPDSETDTPDTGGPTGEMDAGTSEDAQTADAETPETCETRPPCGADASCSETPEGPQCACNAGFEGDGETCQDIDECAAGADDCDPNATCSNDIGGFTCACNPEWVGDGRTCFPATACNSDADCDSNATCAGEPTVCECNDGYLGDGLDCQDRDECSEGSDSCDANAACTNSDGAYDCACLDGFEGDGFACSDIDECATGVAGCDSNATCSNLEGTFECSCDSGFVGDGFACADVDECQTSTHDCDANATCTNEVGSFTCACSAGFEGDGRACTDIDECARALDNCAPEAYCTNAPGTFSCSCPSGFTGDGTVCDDAQIDEILTLAPGSLANPPSPRVVVRERGFECVSYGVGARNTVATVRGSSGSTIESIERAPCSLDLVHVNSAGDLPLSPMPSGYLFSDAEVDSAGNTWICASAINHSPGPYPNVRVSDSVALTCWAILPNGNLATASVVAGDPEYAAWLGSIRSTGPDTAVVTWVRDFSFQFLNMANGGRPATDGTYETSLQISAGSINVGATTKLSPSVAPPTSAPSQWTPTVDERNRLSPHMTLPPP